MHGPGGTDYRNDSMFVEVLEPVRLVYIHVSPPKFQSTVTFEDLGGRTRLTLRSVFETKELRDRVVEQHGAVEGARQTLARLGRYLAVAGKAPARGGRDRRA
jgi:uncharacterized protein YndB with AHSA1/START domain